MIYLLPRDLQAEIHPKEKFLRDNCTMCLFELNVISMTIPNFQGRDYIRKSDKTVTNLDLTTKDNVTRDSFKKMCNNDAT